MLGRGVVLFTDVEGLKAPIEESDTVLSLGRVSDNAPLGSVCVRNTLAAPPFATVIFTSGCARHKISSVVKQARQHFGHDESNT